MRTDDRARYKNIGDEGDAILSEKTVSVAGLGAVGSTVAVMLGRENLNLRLVDMGRVVEAEMHRLSLFYEEDITKFKVKLAKARINAINPTTQVKSFHEELNESNIFLLKGDVIVDATNNPNVNELTFKHAIANKTPLVLVRYCGDTAKVLVVKKKVAAKVLEKVDLPEITKKGIFGPVTNAAASIVTGQVLKTLLDKSENSLIEINAWTPKLKVTKL